MRRSSVPYLVAAAAYALLTIAFTWPLALHPGTLVANDLGDPLLNVWIVWWNATAVPLTDHWWNAPQFYPFKGALALSEHLLGLVPITTPIIWATGNPLLAYNAAFLLAFFLSGLSAHYLVHTITGRHDAAFAAGVAFAFAPYRIPQAAHIQVLSAYWMPLALAALHRYFQVPPRPGDSSSSGAVRRWPWLVLFAVAWMMQALACGYHLFSLTLLVGLWLAWFGLFRGQMRALISVLVASVIAAAALSPVLYGYWRFANAYNIRRTLTEIRAFSADIASVLKASDQSVVWGWLDVLSRPESDLFPGLTVVLLTIAGIVVGWRRAVRTERGYVKTARVLVVLGILAAAIAAARALHGPFRIEIGGLRLLSVTSPEKPVSVAALCFVAAALLHPAVRAAWTHQSTLTFYALAAFAMWLMSLGPSPTLMNAPAIYKAPYAWLLMFPGADGIRVPARFWMVATLCLAVSAAVALRKLQERWPGQSRLLAALAIAGVLLDGLSLPVRTEPEPVFRPSKTDADVRLELPLGELDTIALYRATAHGRPLINGYSGYFAPHYWGLRRLLAVKEGGIITRLSEFGSIEVLVEHALDLDGGWRQFVSAIPGARLVASDADHTTYLVPRREETTPPLRGTRVPFRVSAASINDSLGLTLSDGNLYTRWHAGREQRRGDWIELDLSSPVEIKGIEMLLGGYVADHPRGLKVETSEDQQAWSEAWTGDTALLAVSGALDRPRDVPISIPFEPRRARYVRLTQTGSDVVYYWSIAELRVLR